VSLLRRLFGGDPEPDGERAVEPPASQAELEAAERDRERELMRGEAERLDELRQRQLRYAEHAWTPPPQGGDKRADDEGAAAE
jgi:hypothetical protein